jgi:hypothetical protein
MAELWGQSTTTTYKRVGRIEASNPLGGEASVHFYWDTVVLDADNNPIAVVPGGVWTLTQAQAAVDPVLGPLAYTLQTTLNTMAETLYNMSVAPPPAE